MPVGRLLAQQDEEGGMHAVMASHGPARAASPAGAMHCSCVGAVDDPG